MKHQKPKGTRDFYPEEMAFRQYLHDTWRKVSLRNGFEQVDGPIYEHLDLYKVKSGDGIISELFSFRRHDGETDYAIRPEFTPTLARMVADKANSLPRPIKWFCIPNLCRAERHQRGRLREFFQWNCDIMGLDDVIADSEIIFTLVDLCQELGLRSDNVKVKISHRETVSHILKELGVPEDRMTDAFNLLDKRGKIDEQAFMDEASSLGMPEDRVTRFDQICRMTYGVGNLSKLADALGSKADLSELEQLDQKLAQMGLSDWCEYDLGIVRGLAYYTGTVFELHETTGVERAMAGGGRYDKLIELFGGPKVPAVGFGMGDVVLELVLRDKQLTPNDVMPKPDVYAIAASDIGAEAIHREVAKLRLSGYHARFSYKTTRNIGKLLKDVEKCGARFALIIGDDIKDGIVSLKNMQTGDQQEVKAEDIVSQLQ